MPQVTDHSAQSGRLPSHISDYRWSQSQVYESESGRWYIYSEMQAWSDIGQICEEVAAYETQ